MRFAFDPGIPGVQVAVLSWNPQGLQWPAGASGAHAAPRPELSGLDPSEADSDRNSLWFRAELSDGIVAARLLICWCKVQPCVKVLRVYNCTAIMANTSFNDL